MKEFSSYISINSEIRFGKPCIKGTRITVADILQWLASEMTIEQILEDYPSLKKLSATLGTQDKPTTSESLPSILQPLHKRVLLTSQKGLYEPSNLLFFLPLAALRGASHY